MLAADLMSRSVVAISPDAPLAQAIRLMIDHRVSGLPVIWAPRTSVSVVRDAIGVLAENVPGVKRVENRLICIEPASGMLIYDPDQHADPVSPKQTSC